MFGQSTFAELIFAQQPGADTTIFPSWDVQCKAQTDWIDISKNEIGISPCNDGSITTLKGA